MQRTATVVVELILSFPPHAQDHADWDTARSSPIPPEAEDERRAYPMDADRHMQFGSKAFPTLSPASAEVGCVKHNPLTVEQGGFHAHLGNGQNIPVTGLIIDIAEVGADRIEGHNDCAKGCKAAGEGALATPR
ncbi:hypothetical protein JOD20_004244 [Herpetosiphon giganteus]|nr:hypothetical protein [Herpetosiphon giganteus]